MLFRASIIENVELTVVTDCKEAIKNEILQFTNACIICNLLLVFDT